MSIELQRQQVLQTTIQFLPAIKALPTDYQVHMAWIEPYAFEAPTFLRADFMRQVKERALRCRIELNGSLRCVCVVAFRCFGIGSLVTASFAGVPAGM